MASEETTQNADGDNKQGAESAVGDTSGGTQASSASAADSKAEPIGVTTDDKPRFLIQVVANKGLSKAAKQIAEDIGVRTGVLIVDDMEPAASNLHYIDIKNKLKAFKKLVEDEQKICDDLRKELKSQEDEEEAADPKTSEGPAKEVYNLMAAVPALAAVPAAVAGLLAVAAKVGPWLVAGATGASTVATEISEGIEAIAKVISYFRAQYEIKGQDLGAIDEFYIKALVGNHLVAKGTKVILFDFRLVGESGILRDLSELLQSHLNLLSCLETVDLQGMKPRIDALQSFVDELRTRYIEAKITINDQVLRDLENEIEKSRTRIAQYQQNRFSDTQVEALEAHLSELQTKLVEAVSKDTGASELALRTEIDLATEGLEKPDTSQAKREELTAHRTNMLAELAKVLVLKNSNTIEGLKGTIAAVEAALTDIRGKRVPQSRIEGEELHLAALLAKKAELIAMNDNDAANALEAALDEMEARLNEWQRLFLRATRQVNAGKRISDTLTTYVETITMAPSDGAYSPLIAACLQEYVANQEHGVNFLLKLKLMSAGGEVITSKDFFRFWATPDMSYLAGGIIGYLLTDRSGNLLAADTVYGLSKLEHDIGDKPESLNVRIDNTDSIPDQSSRGWGRR